MLKYYGYGDKTLIPVSPAAHYTIGGIEATSNGKTSVEGIFAVGESSCTGVHGATDWQVIHYLSVLFLDIKQLTVFSVTICMQT